MGILEQTGIKFSSKCHARVANICSQTAKRNKMLGQFNMVKSEIAIKMKSLYITKMLGVKYQTDAPVRQHDAKYFRTHNKYSINITMQSLQTVQRINEYNEQLR